MCLKKQNNIPNAIFKIIHSCKAVISKEIPTQLDEF